MYLPHSDRLALLRCSSVHPSVYQSIYHSIDPWMHPSVGLTKPRTPQRQRRMYLQVQEAPERLAQTLPAALLPHLRFIVTLREPVSRDLSWFNHQRYARVASCRCVRES